MNGFQSPGPLRVANMFDSGCSVMERPHRDDGCGHVASDGNAESVTCASLRDAGQMQREGDGSTTADHLRDAEESRRLLYGACRCAYLANLCGPRVRAARNDNVLF